MNMRSQAISFLSKSRFRNSIFQIPIVCILSRYAMAQLCRLTIKIQCARCWRVLWRAFLAINSLLNKPFDARRFKIDQDFLLVCTAPGNGPALIFEFDDYVIAVEVTLTDNSRQEDSEGEPVRRHVADLAVHYAECPGKPVYGLFIANRINSNTAETFRIGVWYTRKDVKMQLNIVSMTRRQFKGFFEALFRSGKTDAARVRTLLDRYGSLRGAHEAPAWKRGIEQVIQQTIQSILMN